MDKTILVVDDNPLNHKILVKILKHANYKVLEAMDGKEALDILETGTSGVNIILLDLLMPVMDGYQLMEKLNENGLINSIPVIVLTGDEEQETEIKCLQAGASDFLKKPYNAQLVLHKVDSILRLWDNARLIGKLEKDSLTGLYNKEIFLKQVHDRITNNLDKKYIIMYYNIEDFKLINAHYGNAAGDKLLKHIGKQISDRWSEIGICGRLGSDTFGVLIPCDTLPTQERAVEVYNECMKDSPMKGVAIKCGVFEITDRSIDVATMCDYAKIAEESIKHQYGVVYSLYDDNMRQKVMREHQLSNYMEDALEKKQFLVYLQPKTSTDTEAIAGAEALVRWIHPELGFISPGEFIPLFEKNGFIAKLDYYVWKEVCIQLNEWHKKGIETVPISVNASRADFLNPELPQMIDELIEKYDIQPEQLHIEVTESAYTDNPTQMIPMVSALRDMGFKIEMDDFGSGYSSLNMLSELPIDILKLDMRFMEGGGEKLKGNKRNILSFIVSLSKWLQLPTVAEGVETKSEVEDLKSMGVNYIQGYYFAKPMPMNEFEQYMEEHREKKTDAENIISAPELEDANIENGEKPKILIVEDIESNRILMKKLLSPYYQIEEAENGQIAYDYIKENYEEISCILLDLLMPVMDGFQVLEKLHFDDKLSEIPVIITTETGSNGELRALNLGAHSFVAKPYNPDVLRHHVRKAVEERAFIELKKEYLKNKKI